MGSETHCRRVFFARWIYPYKALSHVLLQEHNLLPMVLSRLPSTGLFQREGIPLAPLIEFLSSN